MWTADTYATNAAIRHTQGMRNMSVTAPNVQTLDLVLLLQVELVSVLLPARNRQCASNEAGLFPAIAASRTPPWLPSGWEHSGRCFFQSAITLVLSFAHLRYSLRPRRTLGQYHQAP
jgi:hypothetical protein